MSIRVGFAGVPGSGKSTLCRMVAAHTREFTNFKTVELVSEYARQFIHKYGIPSIADQFRVFSKQLRDETQFPPNIEIIYTDSPVFLGFAYSLLNRKFGTDPESLKHTMLINDLFKEMSKLNQDNFYDIIFHLPPLHKPVADGIRAADQFDPVWREEMDLRIRSCFMVFPPKQYITIQSDSVPDRMKECFEYINKLV